MTAVFVESSRPDRSGLVASFAPATSGLGTLFAVGVTTLVVSTLSIEQLGSWGWRLLGAAMSAAFLLARITLQETPAPGGGGESLEQEVAGRRRGVADASGLEPMRIERS